MENKIIDCAAIAQKIKDEVKTKAEGKGYKLTVLTNPHDEASKTYVRNKKKTAEYCGIEFEEVPFHLYSNTDDLHRVLLEEWNPFIVQLPMSNDLSEETLRLFNQITDDISFRDADGFMQDSLVEPATPKGVMRILDEIGCNLEGLHVVVVGRSDIVGKPVARMCLERNATVTICHSKTKDLASITSQADVLIVAVGRPKMITAEHVKDGAIVIDVGINRDLEINKLCGDVDLDSVLPKVSKITPVPRGVGLLTVACLMENVVELYELGE